MPMSVEQLRTVVGNGRFFGVRFVKRTDGSIRHMVARTGVASPLTPTSQPRTWDPASKGLLQVWDVHKRAYRLIPAESILEIHAGGQRIVP